MRMKTAVLIFSVVMMSIPAFAQDLMSREDFRNAEWRMKSEYYQNLLKRGSSNIALDQTDFDVKYWELDIDVTNLVGEIIHGKVTMTSQCMVDGVSTVDYDFHSNMMVDSVFMGGSTVSFTRPSL